jgi:hypothetical protein
MLVDGKWISKWQPVETVDGKACNVEVRYRAI